MKRVKSNWIKLIISGTILIIIYKLINNFSGISSAFGKILDVLFPCLLGIVIAFFLYKPTKKIEALIKKVKFKPVNKKSLLISVLLIYLIIFVIIGLGIKYIVPKLYTNAEELVSNIPSYVTRLNDFVESNKFLSQIDSLNVMNSKISEYLNFSQLNKYVGIIKNIANSFISIFMGIIISIYIILDKVNIFNFANRIKYKIFSKEKADLISAYTDKIVTLFYSYFAGLAVDAVLMGTISAVVLSIFRVPYAALLGVVVFFGNMIPFFGPIISTVTAYIITAIAFGPIKAICAVVFQLVLGQVDGNLIQPKILSNSVGVSPLLVLVSVIVFGNLFGFIGMILGVPVCAVIKMLVLDYMDNGRIDASK